MRRSRVAARPLNTWLAPLMPDAGDPVSHWLATAMNAADATPAIVPVIATRRARLANSCSLIVAGCRRWRADLADAWRAARAGPRAMRMRHPPRGSREAQISATEKESSAAMVGTCDRRIPF
jgi:hypothetical protein